MAAMLSANSRIAGGPETQLLIKIKAAQMTELLADPEWPKLAVKNLSKVTLADQRVIDLYNRTEDQLTSDLENRPQSIASLFESIVGNFALSQNKPRWVEKTPRHLLHLETIRREFPDAKIIRIVRDPRDSALSMRQLNWTSDDYLPNLYIWKEWYEKTDSFFESDTNSTTVLYENLANSPKEVLSDLCEFIGEDFEDGMLQTGKSGRLVSTANEVWKQQVSKELDTSRCYRWKIELSAVENAASEYLVRKWLTRFNYEAVTSQPQLLSTEQLDTQFVEQKQNQDFILSLASQGYSLRKTVSAQQEPKLLLFLTPEQVSSNRLRKQIEEQLFRRAIRLKKTIVLLHPNTKIKTKARVRLWLLSSGLYQLPISARLALKKLGLRTVKTSSK